MTERYDADEVRGALDLVELIRHEGVELTRRGREYVGLCPFHAESGASFTVYPAGRDEAHYHCFGCSAHGDAFKFVMALHNLDFPAALKRLAIVAGVAPCTAAPAPRARQQEREDYDAEQARGRHLAALNACKIWKACSPAPGTLVETYLRSRGIEPDKIGGIPPTLRYHPRLEPSPGEAPHPAMVGAVQSPEGSVVGIHRTFLAAGGSGKAPIERPKRMLGACWQGSVRLGAAAPRMYVCEGIETGLSILAGLRAVPPGGAYAVWCALSLGNIGGAGDPEGIGEPHPQPRREGHRLPTVVPDENRPGIVMPPAAELVVICADNDDKDPPTSQALIMRAVARFQDLGLEVRVARPPVGMDYNDLLRAGGDK